MSKIKATRKNNIVSASYIRNQARRSELQTQAKRKKEGRKLGFFILKNQFRAKYGLLKWDLLANILILASFFWGRGLAFLAIIVYLQVYIASYFIFNYRKYRLAPLIMSFSILPFFAYYMIPNFDGYLDPNMSVLLRSALLFSGWAILSYGAFWFIIIYKNRKEYQNAQVMEFCMVCDKQKEDFVIHMGHYLCKDCYLEQAYQVKEFNGTEVFVWDYNVLSYLEQEIGVNVHQVEPYGILVDDLDVIDRSQCILFGAFSVHHPLECILHCISVQVRAIMELHSLPDLELDGCADAIS